MNLNPRSIYNKADEFISFIQEHQIHCIFISESWERPEFDLSKLIHIEDFTVLSYIANQTPAIRPNYSIISAKHITSSVPNTELGSISY